MTRSGGSILAGAFMTLSFGSMLRSIFFNELALKLGELAGSRAFDHDLVARRIIKGFDRLINNYTVSCVTCSG